MSKLVWDQDGDRLYETGVDRGVLFPKTGSNGAYAAGVAWNGLTAVNESPSGAEPSDFYADNLKYATLMSNEEFGFTIEAYTYPEEFAVCDGSASLTSADGLYFTQQPRKKFGFCYRTLVGNDEEDTNYGYKLHIVYNCLASASDKSHSTINDSPDLQSFSWEVKTTPVDLSASSVDALKALKPVAHLVVDSTKVDATKLAALEAIIYGSDGQGGADAAMPTIEQVYNTIKGS